MVVVPDSDRLAAALHEIGRTARGWPASMRGGHSMLLAGPGGEYMGRVLPGLGVAVPHSPRALGLLRFPRHVYEIGRIERIADALAWLYSDRQQALILAARLHAIFRKLGLADEVGAITSLRDIVAARGNGKGEDRYITKTSFTTVAGVWFSTFLAGGIPVAGSYTAIPGGSAPDRSATGALSSLLSNPTNPDKKYLLTWGWGSSSALNWGILLDLLVACGNINANATGNQTINSTALTRYTGAVGVMGLYDITTALGATASNITTTYTNQAGTGSRTSPAVAAIQSGIVRRVAQNAGPLPFLELASGDTGIKSVETTAMSAAMGAGVIALQLVYPLAALAPSAASGFVERDFTTQIDGVTELVLTAGGAIGCLTLLVNTNTTTLGVLSGFMRTAAG